MKKSKTLILLLSIFVQGVTQTTWYSQTPGTNKILTDVCFVDENNGWISGWTGTILHTSDGGATWTDQGAPPTNAYWSLYFTDAQNGWASGFYGKIIHTTNGGTSWTEQSTPTTYDLYSIHFADSIHGWAAGGSAGSFPSYINHRIILYTDNGGDSWSFQYAQSYESRLNSIYFLDDQNGYATGEGGSFLQTTNGGTNWSVQTINSSFHFNDVFFINQNVGWVCGEYLGLPHYASVFKTTDGGLTWTEKPLGNDETMRGIYFTDDLYGWAVGNNNSTESAIYHTTDGGDNWIFENTPGILSLSRVFFINKTRGWAAGYLGTIVSTFDPTAGLDLSLKVFLEGPFNNTEMETQLNAADQIPLTQPYNAGPWNYPGNESVASIPNPDVVDWILMELRDATSAATATQSTRVARQAAFLLKDGSIKDLDGSSYPHIIATISNDPYIVIWHRNHLGILSATSPTSVGGVYEYDFSTGPDKVYGGTSGYKLLNGSIYGMVGGDNNSNGVISNSDKNAWKLSAGKSGYIKADFNMSDQANNTDKNDLWRINLNMSSQVPD